MGMQVLARVEAFYQTIFHIIDSPASAGTIFQKVLSVNRLTIEEYDGLNARQVRALGDSELSARRCPTSTSAECAACNCKSRSSRRAGPPCVAHAESRGRKPASGFCLWASAKSGPDHRR